MPGTPTTYYQLVVPTVSGDSNAWGGELNGDLSSLDTVIGLPRIVRQVAATTGAVTLDLGGSSPLTTSGLFWQLAPTGAVTLTFANPPPNVTSGANVATKLTVKVVMGGTSYAITWPGSVTWLGTGASPVFGVNTTSVVEFYSNDNGTTWLGWANTASGQNNSAVLFETTNVSITGDGTVATYTVPANTLTTAGQSLWIRLVGTIVGAVGGITPTVSVTLGGSTISAVTCTQNGPIWIDLEATYVAAASQLTGQIGFASGNPTQQSNTFTGINMAAGQALNFTLAGTGGVAGANFSLIRVEKKST